MKETAKLLFKRVRKQYINVLYNFRGVIKWTSLNGVQLDISDGMISRKIFNKILSGDYESDENYILRETFTENDSLLELGTGIGFNSIYCARVNNNKVMTFEGNSNLISLIRRNMRKNNTEFDLRNEILISRHFEGTSTSFNIAEDFWASSVNKNVDSKVIAETTVPVRRIHEVVRQFKPSYLVVDIEGGEDEIFASCDFLQNSCINKILVELHPEIIGEEKCFEVMKNIVDAGYKIRMDGSPKYVVYFFK